MNKKINKPFLVATIMFVLASIMFAAYLGPAVTRLVKTGDVQWGALIPTFVDFVASVLLCLILLNVLYDESKIKHLWMVFALFAGVSIFYAVNKYIRYAGLDAVSVVLVPIIKYSALGLIFILLAVYAFKRSKIIIFACSAVIIFSVYSLYTDLPSLARAINQSSDWETYSSILNTIFQTLGLVAFSLACLFTKNSIVTENKPKTKKIVWHIVFSILTLGIYLAIWMYDILVDMDKLEGKKSNRAIPMTFALCIPLFYLYVLYSMGKRHASICEDADMSGLFVVQGLFLLCPMALGIMQNGINNKISQEG